MKKFMKKALATLLALVVISSAFVCLAAVELNQDAVNAHYGQFKNYVLLGDSVASGYRDEMSENDELFNESMNDSTFYRYEGSYADVLANAIIADKSMTALAGPGFRTIEMRYMLEDDFAAECDDPFLFWPSHLYVYKNQVCACHGVNMLPGSEHFRDLFKKSIAEADLITLGIGGNDWGAYLGWVINKIFEEENFADQYIAEAKEILEKSTMDMATVEQLVELAHKAGALRTLLPAVLEAVEYGLGNFYKNWDIMIQDIYDLNPDVTLMVLGMSDNSLKGKYYDYDGVIGEDIADGLGDAETSAAMTLIVDAIMTVGNLPMIEGEKKFGYTYVDTAGTTYVDSHPDADGHVFIANKIIEALPSTVNDGGIYGVFSDVTPGDNFYSTVEYVVSKEIMAPLSVDRFGVNEDITVGQFYEAYNKILGASKSTHSTKAMSTSGFASAIISGGFKKGFVGFFESFGLAIRVLSDSNFNLAKNISRIQAAEYLMTFNEI